MKVIDIIGMIVAGLLFIILGLSMLIGIDIFRGFLELTNTNILIQIVGVILILSGILIFVVLIKGDKK